MTHWQGLCPHLHDLRLVASPDEAAASPVALLLSSVEEHTHRQCEGLLQSCFGARDDEGPSLTLVASRDVSLLAKGIADGVVPAGGTLDDFLQLVPLGDKRTLALLVLIDKIVDKEASFEKRVEMLKKAERRSHVLFSGGSGAAQTAQIQALKAVIHAEVALLDPHVLSCSQCLLLHRWRSWAHSFVLLLPSTVKVETVEPAALAAHALLSMLDDDSMDCDKDQAEGVATFFTRLFYSGDDRDKDKEGVPSALLGLLRFVEGIVTKIKPFDPEAARKATTEVCNPGIDAAEALPSQLQAVLGKERSFETVNAVSFRAMLRLAIVLLSTLNRHCGTEATVQAWQSWFKAAGQEQESAEDGLRNVLALPEEMLVAADAEAMKAAMAAPSIATDKAVLQVLLTASDEDFGDNPSPMTLMWLAATTDDSATKTGGTDGK